MINFSLRYEGNDTDEHMIDFYDVAHALIGFQRSLALTTHLVMNGEVITQATSLKNAHIFITPPEEGSWKVVAGVAAVAYALTTAPKDTPLGHLMHSAYDYVISETMGFHVDYDQSLGQQYETMKKDNDKDFPILERSQFDSVIEKCEYNIQEMHRPIVKSGSALRAFISSDLIAGDKPFEAPLTYQSYEYIKHTEQSKTPAIVQGKISSYNLNTHKGRIFIPDEGRPIPFTLSDSAKGARAIMRIMNNMTQNAHDRFTREGDDMLYFTVLRNVSRTGRVKSYYVLEVE